MIYQTNLRSSLSSSCRRHSLANSLSALLLSSEGVGGIVPSVSLVVHICHFGRLPFPVDKFSLVFHRFPFFIFWEYPNKNFNQIREKHLRTTHFIYNAYYFILISAADRFCFPKNCSCPLPPPMLVTSGTRPINCKAPRDLLLDVFEFEGEPYNYQGTSIMPTILACYITTIISVTLAVAHRAFSKIHPNLRKGIHNLVIVSGDKILLSVSSIRFVDSGLAKLSAVLALLGMGLAYRAATFYNMRLARERLKKQAQAMLEYSHARQSGFAHRPHS